MKKSYDFSNAERGKFYKENTTIRVPIYLDPKLQGQLQTIADHKGKGFEELVSQLLSHEVKLLKDLS
ncbi:MAG: hypothetical protein DHS20C16_35690 [Phycisphaerae bacterium]|nr:MAG: hypothetical protein DHS20C16_35690 [Phycisphaerae bacterium]